MEPKSIDSAEGQKKHIPPELAQGKTTKIRKGFGPSKASSASHSSSRSLVGGECEVFLSFSGQDTGLTFTDFLYICLEDAGVRTDELLRRGEDIGHQVFQAIRESKISIPIFSKNYASSQWCLRELALMVECKRSLGQLILPIFYDVEPYEVRYQSGVYEEAFRMHENRFDETTVNQWKKALEEVGELKGWDVKTHADGHQGKLIKEAIVPRVLLVLKKDQMDSETGPSTVFHSSSTSVVGGQYEVFLSFRGPDTRHTFTDFLYTYLEDIGVRTFRDDDELHRGEKISPELPKVLMESKISIPIFSRNYASSERCLNELAQMVECRRAIGQLILPIFYDIEPLDVRRQSGSYEEAFQEHMKNYDERTVKKWKEALKEVAGFSGLDVKKHGHQGKLIKQAIVPRVLLELKKNQMDSERGPSTVFHSSSRSLVGGECEVFLSFSGLDTRLSFTDFLYICLEDAGVQTFRNDELLRRGEDIGHQVFQAIRESKISIPIFSKNYASSQWCLRELALMVECKRSLGQLILPIFYDVKPYEVRYQSGVYEEAFRMHENRFDETTVNQWKKALEEVGELKGWDVKTHADGHQGKLIKEAIVPRVLLVLKKDQMDSETGPSTVFHSSSTSVVGGQYEVFLSFRGPDTRHTFTDFLYTYLEDIGVRTFRDDDELHRGEKISPELPKVLMESKISIPIFSRNYASSERCLNELAQMVECRRAIGQLILPIFYDIEPLDVRRQSGSYEEAFQEHMKNYDERTVKKWKEALIEVANTHGWVLSDYTNGLQGKFIKEVVETVIQHLEKHKLAIPDNLVGIDDHVKEVIRLLDVDYNDTRIVGIHGVSGIGKTTIAKFIYNELLKDYECCSFLADVREMTQQPNGIFCLQEQLFHDTVRCSPVITGVNDGIDLIKRWLSIKKVLIVLDDVNEKFQFDCLVGNRDWFGQGSRIIVTTRDKHLLNTLKVDKTYETPRMKIVQSRQLFSIHAFGKKFPPTDYDSIFREVTSIIAGNPLAVEIIASFLSGKSLYDWEVTLQELKEISSEELIKKLAISFDGLNDTQQKIFLDIACHFIGMDKTYAFYMWDDCGYLTEKEINALCRRRLVKLGDDNVLRMHDSIRDFGRKIVMDLGNCSRLWNHKEAFDVLVKQMGTSRVETLSLPPVEMMSQSWFTNAEFKELVNLRYLQMDGVDLVGDFEHLFPRLKWLSWHRCPLRFKPTNFLLKNLVILDLSYSSITEDWEGWNQIKMAKKLKVLDLSFCALTRTPDFSTYATLERLIIRSCKNLVEIDSSVVCLKNLEVVDLSGSFNIEKFPDEILMFENLEEISEYEVFLSFTGPDTFTDFLYHHLNGLRVRTFRDDNELHKGEGIRPEMIKAIKESKISIPIFSKHYASSKRCLQELAQMVECKRTMGQVILPIFYHVNPSDVQCLSWALGEVGALKGWEVKNESNECQQKLINEVIGPAVLLELKKNSMIGTDFLVGINRHQNEMMKILDVDSNKVRIIGIYGMGGIGKTTITKIVYDILFESFDYHCFLADVGETAQQCNGLVDLQKKLLTDTLKWCPDISDVDSGMDVIKHAFLGKKVLVVLDDVIESSQFFRLVGKRDWFGSGSRIIVISKDRNVLNALKVDAMYEPPLMNFVQSLQLFSIHAFRRRFPPKGYVNVSKDVASAAAGLPLTLEVMGSLLSVKEKVVWLDTLKKLKKISHDEVESKLRVSYEALSHAQRQIFLDIACFFTGTDKATVFYMWDDCGYHPEKEFNVLRLMSLIKVERDTNELGMHDEFRTLGRKIVYEEKILGNRSRLWNHDDALDVLEGRRGTEKVEAISLCFELGSGKKPRFASKEFAKLISLRYLRADGIELVGDFKNLFANLRWLCWHGCPPHFKPTNFRLKNLVILDLSDSGITENWGGWNQIKMANKLKILRLADCALRRTPDFSSTDLSSYATLEILILRRCRNLVEIDSSIGDLKNLEVLDISYADIRELPVEIQKLQKLKVIGFKY